jgi:hypothetical protein
MGVTVLSGTAANIVLGSDYSYAATAQHGPVAIKEQLVSMRLGQKPVLFRTRTLPSITEGDFIAAAGTEKNGTFQAVAVRNLTTGALYAPPTVMAMVLAALLILIGIPLIAFLGLGLFFVGYGVAVLVKAFQVRGAVALLQQENRVAGPIG